MGYQSRTGAPRRSVGRREKVRPKTKQHKRRSEDSYHTDVQYVPTLKETFERTLDGLENLGNQRFGLPPFHEHFELWLVSVRNILSEFESSPAVNIDDKFTKEVESTLLEVESTLSQRRLRELSGEKVVSSLTEARKSLERIEAEYADKMREITLRKESEVDSATANVECLRKELDRIVRMRTGILRGISRKIKEQQKEEAMKRLSSAESELATKVQFLMAEEEGFRDSYERRKRLVLEEIRSHENQVEGFETESQIDGSAEARREACEALASSVKGLLKRIQNAKELRD